MGWRHLSRASSTDALPKKGSIQHRLHTAALGWDLILVYFLFLLKKMPKAFFTDKKRVAHSSGGSEACS